MKMSNEQMLAIEASALYASQVADYVNSEEEVNALITEIENTPEYKITSKK